MRNDYLQAAQNVIEDPMVLINVVSKRVKQLKFGGRPLIVSLERLEPEDIAFREIIEGKISFKVSPKN
jgi:DNA-directed RNA polymerase subunit omega